MEFECINRTSKKTESWIGTIGRLRKYDSHYEILVIGRSSILILYGETTYGRFGCFPDFGKGCHLIDARDRFWNREKLVKTLGKVDGITAESALYALADTLNF